MLNIQLVELLEERQLHHLVDIFEDRKIDEKVIPLMQDEELAEFIPSYGDRVLVRDLCKRLHGHTRMSRKSTLLTTLQKKFKLGEDDSATDAGAAPQSLKSRQPNVKMERKIEIGWLNYSKEEGRFVQVRTRNGGGSRKVSFAKDGCKTDIMERGKSLFFPDDISPKGHVDDFHFDVMDFKENGLNDDETVGEMYDRTMLPTMRFYLTTKRKSFARIRDPQTHTPDMHARGPGTSRDLDRQETAHEAEHSLDSDPLDATAIVIGAEVELDTADDSDNSIQFAPFAEEDSDYEATLVYAVPADSPVSETKVTMVIKRNQVMDDMLEFFADDTILQKDVSFRMMGFDGAVEEGVGDGVGRDCITAFWSNFKDACTTGASYRVPFLRHDFGKTKWEAVGRVIVFGWKKFGYFPVWLAPPFMQVAICDEVLSDIAGVREVFLDYVAEVDRDVLCKALADFDSVDYDDIVDALSTYNCRKNPSKGNLTSLVDEIAHKELVQEPMFVAKCFLPILMELREDLPKLKQVQLTLKPTAKMVLRLLQFPDTMTSAETSTAEHLRKYIKGLDQHHMALFLRFCTGSDLLTAPYLTVSFIDTEQSEFARCPVAHTCTYVLELPSTYDNFPQFRSEFNNILSSGMWVMNIA